MKELEEIRRRVEQRKGERARVRSDLEAARERVDELTQDERDIEEALLIVQHVAQKTQETLRFRIGELSSLALAAVFPDPYELRVDFELKRGRSECVLSFAKDDDLIEPYDASGGGCVDVASFALRCSLWTLRQRATRALLILDEPFKCLKGARANRLAIEMVKRVSDSLKIQVLMISDERADRDDIIKGADRVFDFELVKRVTRVDVLK